MEERFLGWDDEKIEGVLWLESARKSHLKEKVSIHRHEEISLKEAVSVSQCTCRVIHRVSVSSISVLYTFEWHQGSVFVLLYSSYTDYMMGREREELTEINGTKCKDEMETLTFSLWIHNLVVR